jgi:hypothetical protein
MRTVGAVVGSQVMAALLTSHTVPGTSLPSEAAFSAAFLLAAGAALVGAVVGLLVTPLRPRMPEPSVGVALEGVE